MPINVPITRDTLQAKTPQEIADETKIPVVWCDHQATRRQRVHGVTWPGGIDPLASTHLAELLEAMVERGFQEAIFVSEKHDGSQHACWIQVARIPESGATRKPKALKSSL